MQLGSRHGQHEAHLFTWRAWVLSRGGEKCVLPCKQFMEIEGFQVKECR